jgi:hypothetical protein
MTIDRDTIKRNVAATRRPLTSLTSRSDRVPCSDVSRAHDLDEKRDAWRSFQANHPQRDRASYDEPSWSPYDA